MKGLNKTQDYNPGFFSNSLWSDIVLCNFADHFNAQTATLQTKESLVSTFFCPL